MKEIIIIKQTHGRSIKFSGMLVGYVESEFNNAHPYWSGLNGVCHRYEIFKTSGNNYVCVLIRYTQWQGDYTTTTAKVCKDAKEVFDFFADNDGNINRFVRELFDKCDIDDSIFAE